MCGIAGFVLRQPRPGLRPVLERMTQIIAHRGPDDKGYYSDDVAYLGHRRLSIIDVAGGHQPLPNEDRTKWIVYNGEVFNHAAIRPELEAAGHRYASHCDTETILHAYEQFGPAAIERFRGMFAFAIWNSVDRTLFCARDRMGIKPFYYYWDGNLFAFASEIKALLEHPEISRSPAEQLFPEYLAFGYTSGEQTLFHGIHKLMAGHTLTLSLAGGQPQIVIRQYWDPPAPPEKHDQRSDADWIAETRERLEETVRMRLMSDVPLGMFLSGGVDSSAIAALIRRITGGPLQTFSVGYKEAAFSELSYAAEVARSLGTTHHEIVISRDDFFGALPAMIWHEDEPIAWPSSVALNFVARLAAQRVKVVLTGEGSDELFAGYERYRWQQWQNRALPLYRLLPGALRSGLRHWVASSNLLSASLRRKLNHTMIGRGDSLQSLFLDSFYTAFPASDPAAYQSYMDCYGKFNSASELARLLYADQKTYLVELLMKQDQMSMAASLESRVPFLDHTFVEFAARVPDRLKIKGGTQKYILKKAVEDLLPHNIIYRPKMGFPTPLNQWLLHPSTAPLLDGLSESNGFIAGVMDPRQVKQLVARHRNKMEDASERLWRLLNLQIWGELFITGKRDRQDLFALPVLF
jgi:asparagine synthase (glutamine-hydrolysing)